MKSIYLKNFAVSAMIIALCLIILLAAFISVGRDYIIGNYRQNMVNCAQGVAVMTAAHYGYDGPESWEVRMELNLLSKSTGNHIFISDENGIVVSCSDGDIICSHLKMQIPENCLVDGGERGYDGIISDLGGLYQTERRTVVVPVKVSDNVCGYVFVSSDATAIFGSWQTYIWIAVAIPLTIFFAAAVFCYVYSRRMAKPLDEIAAASRNFARGDFSVRVKQQEDPTAEMGALIDSFNKMADSLEQAEERRSEFIANVSHELRTPMTTISGFADGILDGTIPYEEQNRYLVLIRDETRRLARLVRGMLDASQTASRSGDKLKRENFDIAELVLQTLLGFEASASKKNLDVDPQLPDNNIIVNADKDAITRVVYNLIDNAVKFAFPGSCLTVRVYKADGKAYICVKDRGETIPPEDLPFIFDRFHKSDRSRSLDTEGVGLGLFFVKTIINNHDEDIAVKSENNETEFVFTLPLAD